MALSQRMTEWDLGLWVERCLAIWKDFTDLRGGLLMLKYE